MQCTANLRNNGEIDHIKLELKIIYWPDEANSLGWTHPPLAAENVTFISIFTPPIMCGVLMLVPPVRSAPSSMSARASLSVKLSSWYRLFPSRVSLQRRTILSSTFPTGERRLASHNAAYSVEIANFYWGIDGKENYCVVRLRPL